MLLLGLLDTKQTKVISIIGAVLFILLLSILCFRYLSTGLLLWSLLIGAGLAYHFIGIDTLLPNFFFIHSNNKDIQANDDELTQQKLICAVCGNKNCPRHRPELNLLAFQPWTNATIPQSVDTALQEFLEIVLQNFVYTWYRELSADEEFVDELRTSVRFIAAVILRRLKTIDVPTFITNKLLKAIIHHLDSYIDAVNKCMGDNRQELLLLHYNSSFHNVMHSRKAEVEYLRRLFDQLFPYILNPQSLHCQSLRSLIREVLTGSVLLPGLDALANPDMVNQIILTALDKNSPLPPTSPPSPTVEILTGFSQPRAIKNSTLHLHMSDVLNRENTRLLYEFIQFLKSEAAINVMQFTLQCENFNNRILTPDLDVEETQELHAMANELYRYYCSPTALDKIMFDEDIVEELRQIIDGPVEDVVKLRNKTCLFKAYDHAYFLLENTFLPLFHQSDFYFSMLCGDQHSSKQSKPSSNFIMSNKFTHQTRTNKKKESGLSTFGSKIIDVFRTNTVDGKFLDTDDWDSGNASPDPGDSDDTLPHPSSPTHNLSTWRVSIPCIAARPDPSNNRKQLFVFIVEVRRVTQSSIKSEKNCWTVARRYKEFYILEQKLKEFHGDGSESPLPTRKNIGTRSLEFMESKKDILEEYLQKLLCQPELIGSQLLHTFLTSDKELTSSFLPDIHLGRMIKTVPMKLLKEKGQHLDPFLQSFIISTEAPKPKQSRMERRSSDTSTVSMSSEASDKYWSSMYGNNANMLSKHTLNENNLPTTQLHGVFDSMVYVCDRLFSMPPWCHRVISTARLLLRSTVDCYVDWFVAGKVSLVTQEHRIVSLVHLLRDVLFFNYSPSRSESDKQERLDETLTEVRAYIPKLMCMVIGSSSIHEGTSHLVDMLQHPKLNKNLSYILLDLVVLELFPELCDTHSQIKQSTSHGS